MQESPGVQLPMGGQQGKIHVRERESSTFPALSLRLPTCKLRVIIPSTWYYYSLPCVSRKVEERH